MRVRLLSSLLGTTNRPLVTDSLACPVGFIAVGVIILLLVGHWTRRFKGDVSEARAYTRPRNIWIRVAGILLSVAATVRSGVVIIAFGHRVTG